MRHRKRGRHLGRTSSHREAMRRNLAANLLLVERIRTTPAKAKEVRPMVERLITLARKGGLANYRRALSMLSDQFIVSKLFKKLGPRFAERPGGYTRIMHLPASHRRLGDNAAQVIMELLPATEAGEADEQAEAATKG